MIESGFAGDFFAEAKGEIWGKVIVSGSAIDSTKQESVKRTGQFKEITELSFFGKTDYSTKNEKFNGIFENYDIEIEEILISKNLVIPVKIVKYYIYELASTQITKDENVVIEDLKNKAYAIAEASIPAGANIGEITFNIINKNGFINVICNIEVETLLSERK